MRGFPGASSGLPDWQDLAFGASYEVRKEGANETIKRHSRPVSRCRGLPGRRLCRAGPRKEPVATPRGAGRGRFLGRCIKCGKCMETCPYVALFPAPGNQGLARGTPWSTRAPAACLCEDFPCVEACPTNALRWHRMERSDVRMGTAVIDEDLCIAFQGMRCEVCYRTCPLIDQAISIDYRLREAMPSIPCSLPSSTRSSAWAAACASSAAWWTSRTSPSASGPTPSIPVPAPDPSTANPFRGTVG